MQIFFTKEQEPEKRICVLPETVKRFIDLGIDVAVEKDIGLSLFITNDLYSEIGAEIVTDKDSYLSSSGLSACGMYVLIIVMGIIPFKVNIINLSSIGSIS